MRTFWPPLFARVVQAEQRSAGDEFSSDVLYPNDTEDKGTEDAEMTTADIRFRRFGRRLLGGLKPEEVTAFLDEVAEALDTAQRLNIEMGTRVRMLEDELEALSTKRSVAPSDAFPRAEQQAGSIVRQDAQDAQDEQDEQKGTGAVSRLEVLRSTALQEVEALLHDAQARAQEWTEAAQARAATIVREADVLKASRQKEAEELLAEARAAAESILMAARDQEAALRQELERLAEGRLRMLDDVRATLNACQEWLAAVDPRRRGPEARNVLSESLTNALVSTDD